MARIATPLFLYAETPLHPGTGAHLGTVDLPVQRERHTGYPIIQGSSLKGVFRALARETGWPSQEIEAVFGPETGRAHEHAGAVSFTDARILLFPVRALGAVFAWTTSTDVLARLRRDLTRAAGDGSAEVSAPAPDKAFVTPNSPLVSQNLIVLEEFSYTAEPKQEVRTLGDWLGGRLFPADQAHTFWKDKLASDLVVLSDDEFREFTRTATEIVTRVRLNEDTKTVQRGGLWTEEHIPSDSAFYSLVLIQDPMAQNKTAEWTAEWVSRKLKGFDGQRIQVGGDETTGRGFALVRFGGGNHGQNG